MLHNAPFSFFYKKLVHQKKISEATTGISFSLMKLYWLMLEMFTLMRVRLSEYKATECI